MLGFHGIRCVQMTCCCVTQYLRTCHWVGLTVINKLHIFSHNYILVHVFACEYVTMRITWGIYQ